MDIRNPWLLAGLIAVLLPVIIEWLFRRRKRQIELPTIRYLLDNEEQEKIRRQDLILLILRMIVIGLLTFAVARPFLQRGLVGGDAQRNVFILMDGTASMNQQTAVGKSFDIGKKKASNLVRSLPAGSAVTVVHLGDVVTPVAVGEADLHTAAAQIESLRAGSGAADVAPALRWIADEIDKKKLPSAEVYVFSDFQKYTWLREGQGSEVSSALAKLSNNSDPYMVDVGGDPKFNYLVTMLEPTEYVMSAKVPVTFRATVESRGAVPGDIEPAQVTFLVDGVKKQFKSLTMGADPRSMEFEFSFPGAGEYLVEVQIEGDDHLIDNHRYYLCQVPEDVRVLILDETAGVEGAAPQSVFLERAIRPQTHPGLAKVTHFSSKVINPLRVSFENLPEYGVVVLTSTRTLTESMAGLLESYVADGGALWVFMGPTVNLYDYNKFLYKDGGGLLPAKLVAKVSGSADGAELPFPQYGRSRHPALVQLARQAGTADAAFRQYVTVEPAADSRVVVMLSNDAPAVLEKPYGAGRVLLSTASAGAEWTYMPALVEYPVLVQELLRYVMGNPDAGVNLNVGDAFRQPVFVSTQHLLLRYPDGSKFRLKPQEVPNTDDQFRIVFTDTTQQGLYKIEAIPEVLPRRRFVVNQGATEGELTRLSEDEFAEAFAGGKFEWIQPQRNLTEYTSGLHTVIEMAPIILFALTALLAIESFLAWRYGRRRGEVVAV